MVVGNTLWTLFWVFVVTPLLFLGTLVVSLFTTFMQYWPLFLVLALAIFSSTAWVEEEDDIIQFVEKTWRCNVYPALISPFSQALGGLAESYDSAICGYNAIAFTNRVMSTKTFTSLLKECTVEASSPWRIVGAIFKTLFRTAGALFRFLVQFMTAKLPSFTLLAGVTDMLEAAVRLLVCVCEDLHPGYLVIARMVTDNNLYCAIDHGLNAIVAEAQRYARMAWNLITAAIQMIFNTLSLQFDQLIENLLDLITDAGSRSISSERLAMVPMFVGRWLNSVLRSLICTIKTEIALHALDNTVVNGSVPLPHVAQPLTGSMTLIGEATYTACMLNETDYDLNLFGALAHVATAYVRFQTLVTNLLPRPLPRIVIEFFALMGPISDDGSAGYDINTPIPNFSTRFMMTYFDLDIVWDTLRRPHPRLRAQSEVEKWPNPYLYGPDAAQYGPPEASNHSCVVSIPYTPIPQADLFCAECTYNRTEANVVTQLDLLATKLDDLTEDGLSGRRIFRPLFTEMLGGALRFAVALGKFLLDEPRYFAAGVDEFLIHLARQNRYDVIFDELLGTEGELGGIAGGIVHLFTEIHPNLHVVPKFLGILPLKAAGELVRNAVRSLLFLSIRYLLEPWRHLSLSLSLSAPH